MARKSSEIRHLQIIEAAAQGMTPTEMARDWGIHHSAVLRHMAKPEIQQGLMAMREAALQRSWGEFQELLDLSITTLRGLLESPLVDRRLKSRVALRLLELGMTGGVAPENATTVILGVNAAVRVKEGGGNSPLDGDENGFFNQATEVAT